MYTVNLQKVFIGSSNYYLIKYITKNIRLIVRNNLFNTYELLSPLLTRRKNSVLRDNINSNYNELLNAYRINLLPNMTPYFI